jgi:hypothetical protein
MYKMQEYMDGLIINEEHIQQVKYFKYLGSLVNKDNSIEEEIKRENCDWK